MINELKRKIDFEEAESVMNRPENQIGMDGKNFSLFMQALLISEGGYVIDTGGLGNVNAEVADRLVKRVKSHPILWKLFFMVA